MGWMILILVIELVNFCNVIGLNLWCGWLGLMDILFSFILLIEDELVVFIFLVEISVLSLCFKVNFFCIVIVYLLLCVIIFCVNVKWFLVLVELVLYNIVGMLWLGVLFSLMLCCIIVLNINFWKWCFILL